MKVKIKSILKSEEEVYVFEGFGIKTGNKIVYFDNNIKTTLIVDSVVSLIRKGDYEICLNFFPLKTIEGYYSSLYGKIPLGVYTKCLVNKEGCIKIIYNLLQMEEKIQNFEFILEYTIDT